MSIHRGLRRSELAKWTEDELRERLRAINLDDSGPREDLETRLVESSYRVYALPLPFDLETPTGVVFSAVLHDDGKPKTGGAQRSEVIERLVTLGAPDEATAVQLLNQQLQNLVEFYGYQIIQNSEIIRVAIRARIVP